MSIGRASPLGGSSDGYVPGLLEANNEQCCRTRLLEILAAQQPQDRAGPLRRKMDYRSSIRRILA